MKTEQSILGLIGLIVFSAASLHAQQAAATAPAQASLSADQILNKIIQTEAAFADKFSKFHPLVETYIQDLGANPEVTFAPKTDNYFLGKLYFNASKKEQSFFEEVGFARSLIKNANKFSSMHYVPDGFAEMLVLGKDFNRNNYAFEYVRREFLGEVRCLVFDVKPEHGQKGTFAGRIWVEDHGYNIVRFNGINGSSSLTKVFFHFDSWRENMGPELWMPSYVYTEESNLGYFFGRRTLRFKAQTKIWGYDVQASHQQDELTALTVESDQVKDNIDQTDETSPVRSFRMWQRQAEDNVIQRLEKAALLAPSGEVNKVLETVISNLEVTNNVDIMPEVRARVLLTSPLESFTIGHTIVLSRGLIDVLPDEASLAMVLGHELAHIALGHTIDTKYAFEDRMFFRDEDSFKDVYLRHEEKEEIEADQRAIEYLKNSPYKDKLGNAGLFLRALSARAAQLPHLLQTNLGDALIRDRNLIRMAELMQSAPQLEIKKLDQIAALPLGGRVRLDAWNANIQLAKSSPVPLLFPREKMPFEVTPVFLHLTRQTQATQTTATIGSK
jgi:Peptidase family M48